MIWIAFSMGFAGSLHCIGMCGPIALLIPTSKNPALKFIQIITYNFGRVITYSLFGLIFGFLGKGVRLAEISQYVSIISGIIIVLIALATLFSNNKLANGANQYLNKLFTPFKKLFSRLLGKEKKNLLAVGLLNGFLPCGLSYGALIYSLNGSSVTESVLIMAAFGIGTIPLMMTFMYLKSLISKKFNFNRIVPIVMIIMGVLLILRGMALGIPLISPPSKKINNIEVIGDCCSADKQLEVEKN